MSNIVLSKLWCVFGCKCFSPCLLAAPHTGSAVGWSAGTPEFVQNLCPNFVHKSNVLVSLACSHPSLRILELRCRQCCVVIGQQPCVFDMFGP
mmetsp:Transcript_91855/g.148290  ORF Transcript_91855/g.148290 Transcript_91855/m.148290 type:complete len:93 (+) Transcript_91855:124-402(+)